MRKVGIVFVFITIAIVTKCFAQADIHFSQFYETSILRNPALTGFFGDEYKIGVYYRNQWSSITNPYETYLASGEVRFSVSKRSEDFLSIGILGYNDKAGSLDQKITTFYPAINYNKSLSPEHLTFLSVGFTAGYIQYSFDPNKATFNNQYLNGTYDPNNPSLEILPKPQMNFFDFGTGINFNSSIGQENYTTYAVGVSAYHFTQPDFSYYKVPSVLLNMRWNGNAGASFFINNNFTFMVQANYAQQGTNREIIGGAMFNYLTAYVKEGAQLTMSLGGFYRYNDAVIPVVKLKYKNLAFATSYDVNVSSLKAASNLRGGLETTVFVSGSFKSDNDAKKKMMCPRF